MERLYELISNMLKGYNIEVHMLLRWYDPAKKMYEMLFRIPDLHSLKQVMYAFIAPHRPAILLLGVLLAFYIVCV